MDMTDRIDPPAPADIVYSRPANDDHGHIVVTRARTGDTCGGCGRPATSRDYYIDAHGGTMIPWCVRCGGEPI